MMMADFDDITGWEEELAAFKATDAGKAFFKHPTQYNPKTGRMAGAPYPDIDDEYVLQLAELYLHHEEALGFPLKVHWEWEKVDERHYERREEYDIDDYPGFRESFRVTDDFLDWYAMKIPVSYNENRLGQAQYISHAVYRGLFSTVRSEDALAFLQGNYRVSKEDWKRALLQET